MEKNTNVTLPINVDLAMILCPLSPRWACSKLAPASRKCRTFTVVRSPFFRLDLVVSLSAIPIR